MALWIMISSPQLNPTAVEMNKETFPKVRVCFYQPGTGWLRTLCRHPSPGSLLCPQCLSLCLALTSEHDTATTNKRLVIWE